LSDACISSFKRRKKTVGNYSKNPQTALQDAIQKGYTRVRFQQGKPILDRELNLAADLADPRRLFQQFIGDGVLEDQSVVDGFRVDNVDALRDDFTITAGRCLVNGNEVVLNFDTTYKTQPHREHVAPLPKGTSSIIYLHVFNVEVNETQDADLHNAGDIGFETALRERTDWEVVIMGLGLFGPDYFPLAALTITGTEGPPSPSSAGAVQASAARVGAPTSVVPPPDDPPVATLTDLRVKGVSLPRVKEDLDFIMNPSHTSIRDAVIGEAQLQSLAVTTDKLANSSVGFVKLRTESLFNQTSTIIPSGSTTVTVATKQSLSPNFYILVNIQTDSISNVSWTERMINGDRLITITNLSNSAPATVSVKSVRILN
jgi:hypothetical protein